MRESGREFSVSGIIDAETGIQLTRSCKPAAHLEKRPAWRVRACRRASSCPNETCLIGGKMGTAVLRWMESCRWRQDACRCRWRVRLNEFFGCQWEAFVWPGWGAEAFRQVWMFQLALLSAFWWDIVILDQDRGCCPSRRCPRQRNEV